MTKKILALCGGIGGAKLALGLSTLLSPEQLTIMVNTGDDFEHLGLHISPDLDTVMYTLAGINNKDVGWGIEGESWQCLSALETLKGDTWFKLGDKDLATHLVRTQMLTAGATLTEVTQQLTQQFNINATIVPMSDDSVRTMIDTKDGVLAFQHYFVREQCRPAVQGFNFSGIEQAKPNALILSLLNDPELAGIIICPSNPFVSIDPILQIPGMTEALRSSHAPVIAISPIVGGLAIKGPTVKMMEELNVPNTPMSVIDHYNGLLDGFIYDNTDASLKSELQHYNIALKMTNTIMQSLDDRIALAQSSINLINDINNQSQREG